MNIFITGGLGILGNSIIKQFSKKNKLIIYDRAKNHKRFLKVKNRNMKFVPGNLTNNKLILKTIRKYKINAIFHLGAQTQVLEALKDPYQTYLINLQSTIKLLEAVRKINNKIIFIYSSSDKAYGEVTKGSYLENYPLNSIYPYDVSKSTSDLIAQSYSKTYGLKVGIIRSANIYGPHDNNSNRIVPETIISALKNKKLLIEDKVEFLGNSNQVEKKLCHSDLFLLPSTTESFGLAALEAMASNVAIISSNAGGLPEINSHGKTGYLTNANDIESMSNYAISILENPSLLEEMKIKGFNKAKSFDIKKIVPLYEKIYEDVLKQLK